MAGGRIRTLKPELLEDELILGLSIPTRWLFVSCILLADDHGNMRANPTYLRNIAFGGDPEVDISFVLFELLETKIVESYTVRGQQYLHVRNWQKHQRIDRPGKPKVPTPEEAAAVAPAATDIGTKGIPCQNHAGKFGIPRENSRTFATFQESSRAFVLLNGTESTPVTARRPDPPPEQHSQQFAKAREDSYTFATDQERERDQEKEQDCTSCINRACAQETPALNTPTRPDQDPGVQALFVLPPRTEASVSDPLGKPDSDRQKKRVQAHVLVAKAVLEALSQARLRVVAGARPYRSSYTTLGKIAERLDQGATKEECLHVVAIWEQECRRTTKSASWFDHATPFRSDQFAQKLAMEVRPLPSRFSSPGVKNRPSATEHQEFSEAALDQLLTET